MNAPRDERHRDEFLRRLRVFLVGYFKVEPKAITSVGHEAAALCVVLQASHASYKPRVLRRAAAFLTDMAASGSGDLAKLFADLADIEREEHEACTRH